MLSRSDFQITRQNFNPAEPMNILRVACGAFMFPHFASKFSDGGLAPSTVSFFASAGFAPPEMWLVLAAAVELVAGIGLVLGLCTRYAALLGTSVLVVAAFTLHSIGGFRWTWNTGGYEYLAFWAIATAVVGMHAWQRKDA